MLLVEDSIVRSTTLKALLHHLRDQGGAKEIHVRVACPPIIAPCFYGIDMIDGRGTVRPEVHGGRSVRRWTEQARMARDLGAESLRTCRWTRSPGASACRRTGSAGRA